jgi:hypothetical protein
MNVYNTIFVNSKSIQFFTLYIANDNIKAFYQVHSITKAILHSNSRAITSATNYEIYGS